MYVHTIIYSPTFSCVGGYCPCDTLMCVDCSWTCGLCGILILITYIRYTQYMYHASHCMVNHQTHHFDIGTVQLLSCFAEPTHVCNIY